MYGGFFMLYFSIQAEQRICPMGEELEGAGSSSSGSERRVRFADVPHAIPDRNVSGASLDGMEQDNGSNMVRSYFQPSWCIDSTLAEIVWCILAS